MPLAASSCLTSGVQSRLPVSLKIDSSTTESIEWLALVTMQEKKNKVTCSDKGVLNTRSRPKRSCRPIVHLNTPPKLTSSPKQRALQDSDHALSSREDKSVTQQFVLRWTVGKPDCRASIRTKQIGRVSCSKRFSAYAT